MARRRMLMVLVVLAGTLGVAGESAAESKIAYACSVDGLNQVCLFDPDGTSLQVLTSFSTLYNWMNIDSSPDGSELLLSAHGAAGPSLFARVPLDGSAISEIAPSITPTTSNYGDVSWVEIPPSVAALSSTSQTISVFLLGMVASALIMRGRQGSSEQT